MKNYFVYGTRPELIKLFLIMENTDDKYIVNTGQHQELLDKTLGVVPDACLGISTGRLNTIVDSIVVRLSWLLEWNKPDRVIVQGDTASAFAAALTAFNIGIPVYHVEAGLRTFNNCSPYPEEAYRQAITAMSQFHFAPTGNNKIRLIMQGVAPNRIKVFGNTTIDAVKKLAPLPTDIDKTVLVTLHRRECNVDNYINALNTLMRVYPEYTFKFVIHPNKTGQALKQKLTMYPNRVLLEPCSYVKFLQELAACHLVLTDSGGLQEEAPTLNKPLIVMRTETERPEGLGKTALLAKTARELLLHVNSLLDNQKEYNRMARARNPFGDGDAAEKIAGVLNQ